MFSAVAKTSEKINNKEIKMKKIIALAIAAAFGVSAFAADAVAPAKTASAPVVGPTKPVTVVAKKHVKHVKHTKTVAKKAVAPVAKTASVPASAAVTPIKVNVTTSK